jgi:CRP/FNR family transcriptional regulator
MHLNATCRDCAVRSQAICACLDDEALDGFATQGLQRRHTRGDVIARAGDPVLACANIRSGSVKLTNPTAGGNEAIVALLHPGDMIGQPLGDRHAQDVVALDDVRVCSFPRPAVARLLAQQPAAERALLARTMAELDRTRRLLVRVGRASALARVAGFIDETARALGAVDDPAGFDLPLTRGEMADMLGLTIETVSRQMTRLKTAGIIGLPREHGHGRRVVIHDPVALADTAEALD